MTSTHWPHLFTSPQQRIIYYKDQKHLKYTVNKENIYSLTLSSLANMHPLEKTNYSDVIKITIFLSWGIIFSVFSLIQTATATAANRKSHLKSKTALLQTLSRLYYSISFSSSNVGISFWRILKDCIEAQEKKKSLCRAFTSSTKVKLGILTS